MTKETAPRHLMKGLTYSPLKLVLAVLLQLAKRYRAEIYLEYRYVIYTTPKCLVQKVCFHLRGLFLQLLSLVYLFLPVTAVSSLSSPCPKHTYKVLELGTLGHTDTKVAVFPWLVVQCCQCLFISITLSCSFLPVNSLPNPRPLFLELSPRCDFLSLLGRQLAERSCLQVCYQWYPGILKGFLSEAGPCRVLITPFTVQGPKGLGHLDEIKRGSQPILSNLGFRKQDDLSLWTLRWGMLLLRCILT